MNASIQLDNDVGRLQAAPSANRATVLMVRSEPNVLTGTVVSIQIGLSRTSIRVGVWQGAQLCARWVVDRPEQLAVRPGNRVGVRMSCRGGIPDAVESSPREAALESLAWKGGAGPRRRVGRVFYGQTERRANYA